MGFKRVGFFRELYTNSPGLPSIRDAARSAAHPDEEFIVSYLRAGLGFAGVGRYVGDVLNPTKKWNVSLSLETDGVWLWRADLPYYVSEYHVELPEDFIMHMQGNDWRVPTFTETDESRLGDQLYYEMGGK